MWTKAVSERWAKTPTWMLYVLLGCAAFSLVVSFVAWLVTDQRPSPVLIVVVFGGFQIAEQLVERHRAAKLAA